MRVTLRRNLKAPCLPVDNNASGYTVRFMRVKIGCVFKQEIEWYIKRDEQSAVLNGTFKERAFRPNESVWVTDINHTKAVNGGKLDGI